MNHYIGSLDPGSNLTNRYIVEFTEKEYNSNIIDEIYNDLINLSDINIIVYYEIYNGNIVNNGDIIMLIDKKYNIFNNKNILDNYNIIFFDSKFFDNCVINNDISDLIYVPSSQIEYKEDISLQLSKLYSKEIKYNKTDINKNYIIFNKNLLKNITIYRDINEHDIRTR